MKGEAWKIAWKSGSPRAVSGPALHHLGTVRMRTTALESRRQAALWRGGGWRGECPQKAEGGCVS